MTRITLLALLVLFAGWPAYARAQQVIAVTNTPVIRMQMRSGTLTIRTWNRAAVQIESTSPVRARRFGPAAVASALPPELTIPSTAVQTPNGPAILPPEGFPLGPMLLEPHDGVVVFGGDGAKVTLTVPASTALVWAMVGRGAITVRDYRAGMFVALLRSGRVQLESAGGIGYVQVAHGPIVVRNSAFDAIRARTAAGNIVFENCSVRQIEATSINGSIAYDDGTFVPGVARFESENGNVAIGIAGGGALIDAHSASGRIFSGFAGSAAVSGSETDAQAVVGAGGPVVTANSGRGGIYLYDGSLRAHGRLQGAWQPIGRMLRQPLQQKLPHRRHI